MLALIIPTKGRRWDDTRLPLCDRNILKTDFHGITSVAEHNPRREPRLRDAHVHQFDVFKADARLGGTLRPRRWVIQRAILPERAAWLVLLLWANPNRPPTRGRDININKADVLDQPRCVHSLRTARIRLDVNPFACFGHTDIPESHVRDTVYVRPAVRRN